MVRKGTSQGGIHQSRPLMAQDCMGREYVGLMGRYSWGRSSWTMRFKAKVIKTEAHTHHVLVRDTAWAGPWSSPSDTQAGPCCWLGRPVKSLGLKGLDANVMGRAGPGRREFEKMMDRAGLVKTENAMGRAGRLRILKTFDAAGPGRSPLNEKWMARPGPTSGRPISVGP